jgi:Ca-activated chloride channel homolog
MKKILVIVILFFAAKLCNAQQQEALIQKGNEAYGRKQYDSASANYEQAAKSTEASVRAKSLYNNGNTFAKKKNWQGAIEAYKKSLAIVPNDGEAKYNLVYAQKQLQQQQEKQQQQKDKQEQDKQQQQQNKQEPQNKQQQQQQGGSNMSKQDAEQALKALQEQEKRLRQGKQMQGNGMNRNKKDW